MALNFYLMRSFFAFWFRKNVFDFLFREMNEIGGGVVSPSDRQIMTSNVMCSIT